jgi:hypothetical protein
MKQLPTSVFFTVLTLLGGSLLAQNKTKPEVTPYEKYVIALPAIDKVEILAVKGLSPNEQKDVDCHQADIICRGFMPQQIVTSKTLTGSDANRVSSLWRKLRQGNGAGCFAPAYVLRFYQEDRLLLATDVCFHCCNVTLPGEGGDGIASMCGSESAIADFREFVMRTLPYPQQEKKR